MIYKNYKGEDVEMEKLEDKELVITYRWFMKYCNVIKKVETRDESYQKYVIRMFAIKDGMKNEIVKRKLKIGAYD